MDNLSTILADFNNGSEKMRYFSISYKKLISLNINTPEFQRTLDHEHVNSMFTSLLNEYSIYKCITLPNPIIIGVLDNTRYILDGQHRLACINRIDKTEFNYNFDVLLVIIRINSEEELVMRYKNIHLNKPVPLPLDMNDWVKYKKKIEKYMNQNYKDYFSNSKRPNIPNFNKDSLITYINDNNIAKKFNNDYKLFIKELEELNLYYLQTYTISLNKYFKNIHKYISKTDTKDNRFIIGIFKNFEWIDKILFKINKKIDYETMSHMPISYRPSIKKNIRKRVWIKRNGETLRIGSCYVCKDKIEYDDFECGHIIPIFYGGETNVSNLEPICNNCNNDMGINNLEEWKKELEKDKM